MWGTQKGPRQSDKMNVQLSQVSLGKSMSAIHAHALGMWPGQESEKASVSKGPAAELWWPSGG